MTSFQISSTSLGTLRKLGQEKQDFCPRRKSAIAYLRPRTFQFFLRTSLPSGYWGRCFMSCFLSAILPQSSLICALWAEAHFLLLCCAKTPIRENWWIHIKIQILFETEIPLMHCIKTQSSGIFGWPSQQKPRVSITCYFYLYIG